MLVILTRPPKIFFPGSITYFLKVGARKILGRTRGPDGVLNSLKRGLDEIQYEYAINKKPQQNDTVHVLSNIKALRWAIKQKKDNKISKLVAGPNLVIIPTDNENILSDKNIDLILITSQWTKDFYSSLLTDASNKIHIWPAGVKIPEVSSTKKSKVIVFKKNVPNDIYNAVITDLKNRNLDFVVLEYGKFNQEQYFKILGESKFMVYLQEVESQGIALQEAWIRNVPTFVWNKGSFEYPSGHIVTGNVSAPFLTSESGMFFNNIGEFKNKLDQFIENLPNFAPRSYSVLNLSDKASAETYVKIIESSI